LDTIAGIPATLRSTTRPYTLTPAASARRRTTGLWRIVGASTCHSRGLVGRAISRWAGPGPDLAGRGFPEGREFARRSVTRRFPWCLLEIAIGVGIELEAHPFSDQQIALLQTFADQAVIAIQNVCLFQELEGRNRELTETLEQQTATGEILRVISSSPTDVQPVFDAIVESAVRLCEAFAGALLRFDGELLHQGAVRGPGREQILQAWVNFFPYRPGPEVAIGQAVLEHRVIHVEDVLSLPANPLREATQRAGGYRAFLAVPMLRDATVVGVIACWRAEARAFSERQISLVETFADQAVIAIENVRLFTELEARNRDLTTALDRQTATSEILRVISGALVDVQPVFDTIVASAVRLCSARMGALYRFQVDLVHLAAHHNYPLEVLEVLQQMHPRPPRRDQASGRAILDRAVAQIEDTLADAQYPTNVASTFRSLLAVPMLRDGAPIGAIVISRSEPGRFSDGHIALLQTFADQAVIAIENVRLFQRRRDSRPDPLVSELRRSARSATVSSAGFRDRIATIVSRAVSFQPRRHRLRVRPAARARAGHAQIDRVR
jgi:GAF domain-containing protein